MIKKVIVGLGNPGDRYKYTKHNIGFLFLDFLSEKLKFKFLYSKKFKADIAKENDILFIKPQNYMNNSGFVIKEICDFYKVDLDKVIVFFDDVYVDFESFRYRKKGSSGGHNGVQNIIDQFSNQNFERIKIGIKKNNILFISNMLQHYVLSSFSKNDINKIPDIFEKIYSFCIEEKII